MILTPFAIESEPGLSCLLLILFYFFNTVGIVSIFNAFKPLY